MKWLIASCHFKMTIRKNHLNELPYEMKSYVYNQLLKFVPIKNIFCVRAQIYWLFCWKVLHMLLQIWYIQNLMFSKEEGIFLKLFPEIFSWKSWVIFFKKYKLPSLSRSFFSVNLCEKRFGSVQWQRFSVIVQFVLRVGLRLW